MIRQILTIGLVTSFLFAFGCGKSDQQKDLEQAADQMQKAAQKMADAGKEMGDKMGENAGDMAEAMKKMGQALAGNEKVEPVDFRELKKLLPEKLAGMKRTNASGEKNSAFGIKISQAEADYDAGNGGTIHVEITDMGTMKGLARMARFGWVMADVDRESDDGYERTITYRGHKGHEEYQTDSKEGTIQLLVADRFSVEVHGSDVDMKMIKKALDKLDINKLERMKNIGVQS